MIDFKEEVIGNTIKELRAEKGLSQEVLSGLAGLGRTHITMIENGDKLPNFETIWKIANALDMKPHQLVKAFEDRILDCSL